MNDEPLQFKLPEPKLSRPKIKVVKAKEGLKKTQEVVRKAQEEKKRAKEMVMKMKESVREPGIHDCIKAVNDEVNAESVQSNPPHVNQTS